MTQMFWIVAFATALRDSDPLITQKLVDKINSNPDRTFQATLHPQFSKMTIGEAKKFLAPIRKPVSSPAHGSPRPVGANGNHFINLDKRVLTGFYNTDGSADGHTGAPPAKATAWSTTNKYQYVVYDNSMFCASWAPAVTSAMSLALTIHHRKFINLSVQFILDCDIMGDPCAPHPPMNAYEQFWRRYIPQANRWDQPESHDPIAPDTVLRTAHHTLTKEICDSKSECYPGWPGGTCPRNLVMTGSCEPEAEDDSHCPVYFLFHWKWIKSHLWEVGPVTSSFIVQPSFFTYESGVYSGYRSPTTISAGTLYPGAGAVDLGDDTIGMLDVTIIGWGQYAVNFSGNSRFKNGYGNRWWYVVPHLGTNFGESCSSLFGAIAPHVNVTGDVALGSIADYVQCPGETGKSGIVRFNRRYDDSAIESQAIGAVPFNFRPMPHRTLHPTVVPWY